MHARIFRAKITQIIVIEMSHKASCPTGGYPSIYRNKGHYCLPADGSMQNNQDLTLHVASREADSKRHSLT